MLLLLLALLLETSAFAQEKMIKVEESKEVYVEQTMLNALSEKPNRDSIDLDVSQNLNYTNLLNINTVSAETQIGIILNHNYRVSFGVYMIPGKIKYRGSTYKDIFDITNMLSYMPMANSLVHPKLGLGWGAGGVYITDNKTLKSKQAYFAFLQGVVGAEVNISHFLRAGIALGYKRNVLSQSDTFYDNGCAFDIGVSVMLKTF